MRETNGENRASSSAADGCSSVDDEDDEVDIASDEEGGLIESRSLRRMSLGDDSLSSSSSLFLSPLHTVDDENGSSGEACVTDQQVVVSIEAGGLDGAAANSGILKELELSFRKDENHDGTVGHLRETITQFLLSSSKESTTTMAISTKSSGEHHNNNISAHHPRHSHRNNNMSAKLAEARAEELRNQVSAIVQTKGNKEQQLLWNRQTPAIQDLFLCHLSLPPAFQR